MSAQLPDPRWCRRPDELTVLDEEPVPRRCGYCRGGVRHVRQYTGFGPEQAMVVSVYSWECNGPVGELVESMAAVLAEKFKTL